MEGKSQRRKWREDAPSSLNAATDSLELARDEVNMKPVKDVLYSTGVLITTIRDSTINEADCVELGLACADVCQALLRSLNGRQEGQSSQSFTKAIERLTMTVAEIQKHIAKRRKRNAISRRLHARDDREAIVIWRLDLDKIRELFDAESAINTDANVAEIRHDLQDANVSIPDSGHDVHCDVAHAEPDARHDGLGNYKDPDGQKIPAYASVPGESPPLRPKTIPGPAPDIGHDVRKTRAIVSEVRQDIAEIQRTLRTREGGTEIQQAQKSAHGELPPPPPRIFFGRDGLIEEIIGLVDCLTPIALVGAGGIGKTSIALTILHDDRIEKRFGDERRFIRCDQFPPSLAHFLRRLSAAVGAGVENPEDLSSLRSFLSSREIFIILDNAESTLDPEGPNAREIYDVVDELSRFKNICLCITSRISIVPPGCETLTIPTLSMEAACDTFYRIYQHRKRSDSVDQILEQLDFHPLSITLLATVAHHNKWGTDRLTREWEKRRTGVLETKHKSSLAAAIELSLASSMFQGLGPNARELLGVVAFYPQGVGENNLDWLFPTVSDAAEIFDNFCTLSLTYRSEESVKMLAPLRNYLSPKDPLSSPLLCMTRDCYFGRLSAIVNPDKPDFGKTRWIVSEDVNVEHLLDVFTSVDGNSEGVWEACARFTVHLYWHKPRPVVLGSKIEGLLDDHPLKPKCLFLLSRVFQSLGNYAESKRLQLYALELWRDRRELGWVAGVLVFLSDANLQMNLIAEGLRSAKEALEVYEQLDGAIGQAQSLIQLAQLLHKDNELEAAEESVFRAITLLPENGERFLTCQCHRILGGIYHAKGNKSKAINHLEVALGIATSHNNWDTTTFWIYYTMVILFSEEGRSDEADAYFERAKPHALNDAHNSAYAMLLQAHVWYYNCRLGEAEAEALRAMDAFERLGAVEGMERCRRVINSVREEMSGRDVTDGLDLNAQKSP